MNSIIIKKGWNRETFVNLWHQRADSKAPKVDMFHIFCVGIHLFLPPRHIRRKGEGPLHGKEKFNEMLDHHVSWIPGITSPSESSFSSVAMPVVVLSFDHDEPTEQHTRVETFDLLVISNDGNMQPTAANTTSIRGMKRDQMLGFKEHVL